MGGKHRLSQDAASKAVVQMKKTTKTKLPCPFAQCVSKGVCVQRLNLHLRSVHGLKQEQVKAVRGGQFPVDAAQEEEEEELEEQEPAASHSRQLGDSDETNLQHFKSFLCHFTLN